MQNKSSTKTKKSAPTSDFVSKWKKDKSTKSTSASVQQSKNKAAEKGVTSQENVKGMEFSVLVENLSPRTNDQSLLIHFRRFDPGASCKIHKPDPQDVTAMVSFSTKEKMENVLALTHAVDCRLLKLTCKKQQPPSKRPLETTGKNEQPSKKMCLASPLQGHMVYVEGLGTNTSQEAVAEYFKRFGKVVETRVTIAGKGEAKKKVAFISLAKENSAKAAVQKKKHTIDGVGVTVRLAEGSEAQERGDVNGARSGLADTKDEGDGEESDEDEEESDEDEEESAEEEEESSDDDDVQVQPQQRLKIPATAEDSDDEEEEESSDDDVQVQPQQRLKIPATAEDTDDDDEDDDDSDDDEEEDDSDE